MPVEAAAARVDRRRGASLALAAIGLAIGVTPAEARPGSTRIGAAPLAAGQGWLAATYELSLSTRVTGAPWGLALDGAIALSPRLTLGLDHSAAALGTVDRSGGLCLASAAHTCPDRYRGGLLDVRLRLGEGRATVTALARLGLVGLGPLRPRARLGLRVARDRGRWWAVVQPELAMSLGHRELGNRDTLEAPVWLGLDAGPVSAWLRTGVRGDLALFGEKWEVAVGAGLAVARGRWRAGLDLGWPQLLGPQNSFKQRQAGLWLAVER